MAYVINSGSIIELAAEYMVNGQQCINLFHYKFVTGAPLPNGRTAIQTVLDGLDMLGIQTQHAACLSSLVGDITWYGQWIHPTRYAYAIWNAGPKTASGPNTMQPVNVGASITKKGEIAARSNVGTTHMGGVPAPWVVASMITAAGLAQYNLLASRMTQGFLLPTTQEFQPVLFSKSAPATSAPIFEAFAQDTSRVERRRTVGVGS